jgi:hypothetical protein
VDQCTELKGLGDFVSSGKKKDESRSHKQARGLYKMSSSCTFFMGFDDKKKKGKILLQIKLALQN